MDKIWLINFEDITNLNYEKPSNIGDGYMVDKKINLNRLSLILLSKIK